MPVDRATAERALRAAHAAGDTRAATIIARGIRDQGLLAMPAERPDPTFSQRAYRAIGGTVGTIAGTPYGLPGMVAGGGAGSAAAGELERWLASKPEIVGPPEQPVTMMPEGPGDLLPPSSLARLARALASDEEVPGTEHRTPGQVVDDIDDAALEGSLGGLATRVLQPFARGGEAMLRSRARAGMTIPEATMAQQEEIARQTAAGVSDPRSVLRKVMAELAKAGTKAGAVGTGSALTAGMAGASPGLAALAGTVGASGMFVVNTLMRMQPTVRNLLANNPKFAAWALSRAPSAVTTGAAATAGQGGVQAVEGAADKGVQGAQYLRDRAAEAGAFVLDQAGRIKGLTAEGTDQILDIAAGSPETGAAVREFMRGLMSDDQGNTR